MFPNLISDPESTLLGFDPGRQKCGVAILDHQGTALFHQVVLTDQVSGILQPLLQTYAVKGIIIGDQTSSKEWQARLRAIAGETLPIIPIDERHTSQEARGRYWRMYPPKGLCRLIPKGMRVPPRPIDDIVAILLVERYLARLTPECLSLG